MENTAQVGEKSAPYTHGVTDTEQVALLPHGHAVDLLHSQATEALCVHPPPVPELHSPKEKTEQLWCRISYAAHNARQKGSWGHSVQPCVQICRL